MDMDDETKRFKVMLFVGVLLLVSAFFSWREMKYAVFGKRADAKLVRVYETTEYARRGRTRQRTMVEYQFTDSSGQTRKESDKLSDSATPPSGATVPVQYLAGSPGSSRLPENAQRIWMIVFFGTLGFLGYKFYRLVQESKS
jgi:hypothetical protein